MKKVLLSVLAAAAFAGCVTNGDVGVGYSYGYAAPAPDMYVVSDGVSVVAYADYPTFYSDNYYWMYNGGVWYRSGYYGGGWVVAYDVPYRVRGIREPRSYAHFQPGVGWQRSYTRDQRTYNGGYYNNGGYRGGNQGRAYNPPPARDHRTYSPPASQPPPAARDHRSAPPASYGPRNVDRGGPRGNPPARDHRR